MSSNPAFGHVRGSGKSSLRARDAHEPGINRGRGRGKRLLNRGMNINNGNYISRRAEGAPSNGDPKAREDDHAAEAALGFELFTDGPERLGWLFNMNSSEREDKETGQVISVVNCYFQCQDGSMFKAQVEHAPYFYLQVRDGLENEVDVWLRRKFATALREVEIVEREDLDLKNHLSGLKRRLLKLTFWNVEQLVSVRREMFPIVAKNRNRRDGADAYAAMALERDGSGVGGGSSAKAGKERLQEGVDAIVDMREYDVPYHVRFAIDQNVRTGHWFIVRAVNGKVTLSRREDLLQRAEVRVCAFDIETTKLPLQFPNAEYDQVFMISYMLDRQGYLIINREVVSQDIGDFEYTPKPEFEGPFHVFNCANEAALLRRWFDHMREVRPAIYVTYNGDYFDWPFIETRAAKHNMEMAAEVGFKCNRISGECLSRCAIHMDCLHWVNRDSYLPQGSRGLKAVTKYKLGYDPVEVDPENMVRLAATSPQAMASYSVSDAVSTYYLYHTYIHPFIFSLATIIPMPPDEVLRKGSGTLCEALLMVEAARANVIAPNKHNAAPERMHKGHLLESETYIGGKVEALESGVFRADLPCKFRCKTDGYQHLLDKLDGDLRYALEQDAKWNIEDVENYDEVRDAIAAKLEDLRDRPVREEPPLIYHLDVAAMYPNIILTNRLQPSAVVTDEDCAACDFNVPGKTCLRRMDWVWRGETYSATRAEYLSLKAQLQVETFPPAAAQGGRQRTWGELPNEERGRLLKERLKKYCQKVYKRVLNKPTTELREAGVCQRENAFYYDTVRAFRDRRYEYKGLNKEWKGKLEAARASGHAVQIAEAQDMCVLYDSLQLAHKCILNSFYGYVMRKGARWYSMEMAGVVTHTGANIIKRANELISQLGRPLELDTDGIWCALPKSFPEDFKFVHAGSKKTFKMSYPCAMLNVMVAEHNTNDQFATLIDSQRRKYESSSEMTIEFEVDGPYRAMVLPASKEEGKLIKKRYAVFNFDGSLAELKGFELKRRGELKLIKVFQGEVFDQFLKGASLEECYGAVAAVGNRWLDLLDTRGVDVTDEELVEMISETCVMSKGLDEYDGRKSCAITCATRLAQFLGDGRVRDKGLVCHYVVAAHPRGQPTSERAIPVAIFSTEPSVARTFLRRWCGAEVNRAGDPSSVPDVRDIVDWEYYKERLGSAIQKIITIPAAMQRVPNPVPRVRHPDWLHKKVAEKDDTHRQAKIDALFAAAARGKQAANKAATTAAARKAQLVDLEDVFGGDGNRASAETARPGDGNHRPTLAAGVASIVDITPGEMDAHHPVQQSAHEKTYDVQAHGGLNAPDQNRMRDENAPEQHRHESFTGWLSSRKQAWRKKHVERKRCREAADQAGLDARRRRMHGATGVDAMFAQQAEAAAESSWQIVSLAPTTELGTYKAWVVINGRMHAVPLRVPRTLFVDASVPPEDPLVAEFAPTVVKRTLPGGTESAYTYQVTMTEPQYRATLSRLEALAVHPRVRGVFESRLPPDWNASLSLGCVAAVGASARRRNLGTGFDLRELHARTVMQTAEGYFSEPTALQHMGLYHSQDAARGVGLFALHLPADGACHVWVVNPATRGQRDINPSTLEKAWSEARSAVASQLSELESGTPRLDLPIVPQCSIAYVRTISNAFKAVQRSLSRIRDRARGPTVLLLDVPDSGAVRHALPALNDFPFVEMQSTGSTFAEEPYPALGWQLPAIRAAASRLVAAPGWLAMRLRAARYAHLPLASIGYDWVLDTCDALFARQLRDAGHLLWTADAVQPDLGGRPADVASDLILREGQRRLELVWPGAYRCVCLEVKVSHLAVCAVLEAATIGELEGSALVEENRTFKVLRNLAQSWVEDATRRHNICADTLLRHMYRWLCSPAAKLYDPSLKILVQALMRKLLLQLVTELKRLGTTVVYANTSTLILSTGRHSMTGALGYVDYVLDTLRKRELFQWLSLAPSRAWHTLLFADRYNYLGVAARLPERLAASMSQAPGELAAGVSGREGANALAEASDELEVTAAMLKSPQMDCVLTMREYMPAAVHTAFVSVIAEFVWLPWKEAVLKALDRARAATEAGEAFADNGVGGGADGELAGLAACQQAWLMQALPGRFTEKLLRALKHIVMHVGAHDGRPDHQFPRLAGSHLSAAELGTPALAFVKAVFQLYSLDTDVTDSVTVLRRQMLRLIRVKEFGAEAAWRDPCKSLVLPDVVCVSCQDCQDLDLCRDTALQEGDWRCRACGAKRDVGAVEARLVSTLNAIVDGFEVQDLRCEKCRTVATEHLRKQCDVCGGHLRACQDVRLAKQHIAVYRNVAEYQGMEALRELAEFFLLGDE